MPLTTEFVLLCTNMSNFATVIQSFIRNYIYTIQLFQDLLILNTTSLNRVRWAIMSILLLSSDQHLLITTTLEFIETFTKICNPVYR